MQKDPIQREKVIKQLFSQQFFIHPNSITDRTHRLQMEILGAEQLYLHLSEFLNEMLFNLKGIDPSPDNIVIEKIVILLQIKPRIVQQCFQEKIHLFLRERFATEDIPFITPISTILEVLHVQQFQELVDQLYDSYIKLCICKIPTRDDNDIPKHFFTGIRRLEEIADSNISLLNNVHKCVTLAQLFRIEISTDQRLLREYFQTVIKKIFSGGI
ncbi:MAG: hypothetical protein ACFFFH_14715 [Candidatus Thorarchaeota archaeon]